MRAPNGKEAAVLRLTHEEHTLHGRERLGQGQKTATPPTHGAPLHCRRLDSFLPQPQGEAPKETVEFSASACTAVPHDLGGATAPSLARLSELTWPWSVNVPRSVSPSAAVKASRW